MRTQEKHSSGAIPPYQTIPHPSLEIRTMDEEARVWSRSGSEKKRERSSQHCAFSFTQGLKTLHQLASSPDHKLSSHPWPTLVTAPEKHTCGSYIF